MSKPTRLAWPNGKAHAGDVQMIHMAHKMSARRRARIAFWVLTGLVGITTTVVASAVIDPGRALVVGLLVGLAVGGTVGTLTFAWPVLRAFWHWTAELMILAALLAGYRILTTLLPWSLALLVLVLAVAGPFGLPAARRAVLAWIWCAISRHRLRTAFAAFIAANRHGTQPFILHAAPTPAGERIRVWLRSGLSLGDLEERRDKLAVACWGKDVRITPASRTRAALVDIHITRRNPLTALVDSPLPNLIDGITLPQAPVSPAVVPTALDLPDVTAADLTESSEVREPKARLARIAPPIPEPAPTGVGAPGGDLPEWA